MDIATGDLIFLTRAYEEYVRRTNPFMSARLENRLAKIEEIIDWDSEKGKKLKEARLKTGKWADLPLEDNKYILSVYYPELIGRKGQKGVISPGVPSFSKDPVTGTPFFVKMPEWLLKDLASECKTLNIEWKNT